MATWLVLHKKHSEYGDVIGEVYEFPIGIPNSKQIKTGDTLVFCLTQKSSNTDKRILGYGKIDQMETRPPMPGDKYNRQRLAAYLVDYRKFTPVLSFADIGGDPRSNYTNSISRIYIGFDSYKSEFFDFIPDDDFKTRQLYARIVRKGQFQFRDGLLKAYDFKCAISNHGPTNVLEASHVLSHSESGINQIENGILLRSDLHNLFDDGLLKINPLSYLIEIDSALSKSPYYQFNGQKLRKRIDGGYPNTKYLKRRYKD